MANALTASEQVKIANSLKTMWSKRSRKFTDWNRLLRLEDALKQDEMESVASNDPRTGFNLGRHLLVSSIVAHRVDVTNLTVDEIQGVSYLEDYVTKRWMGLDKRYRQMGRQGWLWTVVGWLMSTGWYAVFSMVYDDRIDAEIWSPAETFPDFNSDGINSVAHIYNITPESLARKGKLLGWKVQPANRIQTLTDLWRFDEDGNVENSVVVGGNFVLPPTVDAPLTKLGRLPVFTAPAGGMPDMGTIDNNWQEHFGESIVSVNEGLALNYNKMLTYIQQIARDSATPRWFEQSDSEEAILKQTDLFKRGAIFRGSRGDAINPIASPPIPVELRQAVMDYQNMMQRGNFPWSMYGNVQQQISYLAMANMAASSMQTISPYAESLRGLLNDLDDFWYQLMENGAGHPYQYKKPAVLPAEVLFNVGLDIEIPGYLVQRATIARMLDPNFRLSTNTVMDKLFPEIKNGLLEQGKARKDMAMSHPKVILAESIIAYKEQARLLKSSNQEGDGEIAKVYDELIAALEAELTASTQQQAGAVAGAPALQPSPQPVRTGGPEQQALTQMQNEAMGTNPNQTGG